MELEVGDVVTSPYCSSSLFFVVDREAIAELVDSEREMGGEGGISSTWSSTTVERGGTAKETYNQSYITVYLGGRTKYRFSVRW